MRTEAGGEANEEQRASFIQCLCTVFVLAGTQHWRFYPPPPPGGVRTELGPMIDVFDLT